MSSFCSYCYLKAVNADVNLSQCSKCLHRSYCSRECQVADWKEGHKHWCGKAGEIDYDYEIQESEGKGLGMFALRPFKKGEKIMAERPISEFGTHPPSISAAVLELTSCTSDSWKEKFHANSIGMDGCSTNCLFISMSRVNHHCIGNAEHSYVPEHKVMILYANRAIDTGEEITFSYVDFLERPENYNLLKTQWGFDCQCSACSDSDTFAKIKQLKSLDTKLLEHAQHLRVDQVLVVGQELLQRYNELEYNLYAYARTYNDILQIAVAYQRTLPQALDFLRRRYEVAVLQYGDIKIAAVERCRLLLRDPSQHANYLLADKRGKK